MTHVYNSQCTIPWGNVMGKRDGFSPPSTNPHSRFLRFPVASDFTLMFHPQVSDHQLRSHAEGHTRSINTWQKFRFTDFQLSDFFAVTTVTTFARAHPESHHPPDSLFGNPKGIFYGLWIGGCRFETWNKLIGIQHRNVYSWIKQMLQYSFVAFFKEKTHTFLKRTFCVVL